MKKIRLMLVFTFIISLAYGLEFDSFLSITEDSRSVTSQDSVLYLATPYGISIFDYTNQSLDFVDIFNIVESGFLAYNRVLSTEHYLVNYPTGYPQSTLYDITDRLHPQEIYTFEHPSLKGMQEYENSLYILADSLYVYDSANFAFPPTTLLGYRSMFAIAEDKLITLRINYGEIMEADIELYEFNSPTDIQFTDSYQLSHDEEGSYNLIVQNQRIFIREKSALYVFDYSEGLELVETFDSLSTAGYDLIHSNANESVLVSLDGYYWDISVVNNIVMYTDWTQDSVWEYFARTTIIGDHFFKANWSDGLIIADFSDVENVELIYNWNSYKNRVGIEIVGNTLLDVAFPKLKMFDVSDSNNVHEIEGIDEQEWNTKFDDYLIAEDKLLFTHEQFMTILSTENGVSQPEYCADINLGSIGQIVYYDNHVYNIDGTNLQMQITDISEPNTPEILDSVNVNQIIYAPINSFVVDHYLLLVNEYLRVSIYDLSSPNLPVYLSSFSLNAVMDTSFFVEDVNFIPKNNILYASLHQGFNSDNEYIPKIFIFDIADILAWELINTIDFAQINDDYDFTVVGDYLYTLNVNGMLKETIMFEVDNAGNYSEVASYEHPNIGNSGWYLQQRVHNNKLYASSWDALVMYDIIYYTENESYEIVPSNKINSFNYPNPFNPETTISYDITINGNVSVDIYNLKGQKVKSLLSEKQEVGKHNVIWYGDNDSGNRVSSGAYLYQVKNGEDEVVKKMLLMK